MPCDVPVWFVFDLLAILLVTAGTVGGLYLLRDKFAALFSIEPPPTPVELFVGTAVVVIVAASVLAVTLTMTFAHVRYMVADAGDFRLQGLVGFVLVLALGAVIGYTMYVFLAQLNVFRTRIYGFMAVQAVLVVAVVYFSALLKYDLMRRLHDHTTDAGNAALDMLVRQGDLYSKGRLEWLYEWRAERRTELEEFERLFNEYLRGSEGRVRARDDPCEYSRAMTVSGSDLVIGITVVASGLAVFAAWMMQRDRDTRGRGVSLSGREMLLRLLPVALIVMLLAVAGVLWRASREDG